MFTLRVLSYNIHKGFSSRNSAFVLREIKEAIREVQADLVFLQEVLGHHDEHARTFPELADVSQFEFLADEIWPHFAYGRNAVYDAGHHGNAILSKYPIKAWSNLDISTNRFEQRGLLHAVVQPPTAPPVHCLCVHFGLFQRGRVQQVAQLAKRIDAEVRSDEPLVVAGDFNDWSERATQVLASEAGLQEAFHHRDGTHGRTFPSFFPFLSLDRVYFRGLTLLEAQVLSGEPWHRLSDHSPISAHFALPETTP